MVAVYYIYASFKAFYSCIKVSDMNTLVDSINVQYLYDSIRHMFFVKYSKSVRSNQTT